MTGKPPLPHVDPFRSTDDVENSVDYMVSIQPMDDSGRNSLAARVLTARSSMGLGSNWNRLMRQCELCWCFAIIIATLPGCQRVISDSGQSEVVQAKYQVGFSRRSFIDENGQSHKYALFLPHQYRPGSKLPVLLFLNGLGENGEDGVRQISNNFGMQAWESREFFPFLAIAPQCRSIGSWGADSLDVKWAMQILDGVLSEFGADEDRVYLTGVSAGGNGVWNVASAFPNRFAAIVPLCGAGGDAGRLAAGRVPVWSFCNAGDKRDIVEGMRGTHRELIQRGSSPILTEYPSGGHDCWNRTYRNSAMYAWLLNQRRSQNIAQPRFQYLTAKQLLTDWHSSKPKVWQGTDDGLLVGQNPGTPGRELLVSNISSRSVELHGEVWLRANAECRIALLDEQSLTATQYLSICIVPQNLGSGGVVGPGGDWRAKLDPAAQLAIQKESWNDVRVCMAEERLTVHINGWLAIDLPLASLNSPLSKFRCALVCPDDGSDVRWRYVRIRAFPEATHP